TKYHDLTKDTPGLVGATIARAAPLVMRLACLYALLDSVPQVDVEHLEAALALWSYCQESARYIFGDALGDPLADRIRQALGNESKGLSRTEISDLFQRNQPEFHIAAALALLEGCGLARCLTENHEKGRPTERWFAS